MTAPAGAFERALTADTDAHVARLRVMAVYEAGEIVRAGLAPFVAHRHVDGYASDAEYLSEVVCTDCGDTGADALTCETCDVTGCRCHVEVRRYDCGEYGDGLTLCDDSDCLPSHRGCPWCDPADPRDR